MISAVLVWAAPRLLLRTVIIQLSSDSFPGILASIPATLHMQIHSFMDIYIILTRDAHDFYLMSGGSKPKKDRKKTEGPKKKKTRTTFTAYQVSI